MRTLIRKHKKKIVFGHFAVLALLIANLVSPNGRASISFNPENGKDIVVGQSAKIDIEIRTEVPINAVGATISFPKDKMEIVAISKEKTFLDLWTEETVIREKEGEISFSGGTVRRGGFIGKGTILTLTVKAKESGEAALIFDQAEVLAHDGKGTNVLNDINNLTYLIKKEESHRIIPQPQRKSWMTPRLPNADLNNDGRVDFIDISIISVAIFEDYNPNFDLNRDGKLDLIDLSIVFSSIF